MICGKTDSGFAFQLDESALDDMRLVDALADLEDGDALSISRVLSLLLGKEQRSRAYAHLRSADGRVSVEAASRFVVEMFQALDKAGKNSCSSPG